MVWVCSWNMTDKNAWTILWRNF